MIKKENKKLVIDLGLGLVLSIVMPLSGALLSGHFTWESFLQGFVVAFVAGYTVIELTPVLRWSDEWTKGIGNRAFRYIAKNMIIAVLTGLLIGSISVFVERGFAAFPGFFFRLPIMAVVVFVTFSIWPPILFALVDRFSEE